MRVKVMLRLKMDVYLLCTIMLSAVALTQEMVTLTVSVSPSQTAQCGQPLTLTCRMSTHQKITVIGMSWNKIDDKVVMCDKKNIRKHEKENIKTHNDTLGYFNCSYLYEEEELTLTLTLEEVTPMNVGQYACKLQSDIGRPQTVTMVTLQECYRSVTVSNTQEEGPVCIFTGVHPEEVEVHWFQGSVRLPEDNATTTTQRVEKKWLTLHSKLSVGSEAGWKDYNCSLWNPSSKHYITSRLVEGVANETFGMGRTGPCCGAEAVGTFWKLWGFPLLLTHLLMKL